MVVWALFDSGNGCYTQAVEKYFPDIDIYPIGVDIENKNGHFINLDLANYSEFFTGKNKIFEKLDELPAPDLILASPPCESWSVGSAMKDGNACWYTQKITNIMGEAFVENHFTPRPKKQILEHGEKYPNQKKYWWKTFYNRINGELCAFNVARIIERYKPAIWVIENPQSSRIWRYYEQIHDFHGVKNVAHYSAYDDNYSKKPTVFLSNIELKLKTTKVKAKIGIGKHADGRKTIYGYNNRSNIPLSLIKHILEMCREELKEHGFKRRIN